MPFTRQKVPWAGLSTWFLYSAGALLLLSGAAKLFSARNPSELIWLNPDPVFRIPFRTLFWLAGGFEVFSALLCFALRSVSLRAMLVAFLATNFVIYRIGMVLVHYHKPCPCLGSLGESLHMSDNAADILMKLTLGYLLAGSYAILFLPALTARKKKVPSVVTQPFRTSER